MKDVFSAYFDNVNSRGGIFSRKIEMRNRRRGHRRRRYRIRRARLHS